MPTTPLRLAAFSAATFTLLACSKADNAKVDTTTPQPTAASSPAPSTASADSTILVRGTISSLTANQVIVKTDSASVTVAIAAPLKVYSRGAGQLGRVTPNTFIGVTTVKQPNGAEMATEIHIFPEELRGLGEGSRMMTQPTGGASGSRMTNGSVSGAASDSAGGSRMTNGSVGGASRMSNGAVSSTSGSTMVVQYAGGSTTVTVPPNVTVTEIKPATHTLAAGDAIVLIATKAPTGGLTSNKALLAK